MVQGMTVNSFERGTFTIPRELEFFTRDELSAQTGCPEELWWPDLIFKEAVDNALDCSEGVVAPVIAIDVGKDFIRITDNGPGIEPDVVRRILDYSSRTSAKQAYISPTRG